MKYFETTISDEVTLHKNRSNPLDVNGLCLLSLDGGGVRGLSSLYILKDVMNQLNAERQDGTTLKPCDVFDLIGGTSTGGLIAIMLGRLEMNVDDCIQAYSQLMSSVFSEKANSLPVDWSGKIKAQYESKKLRMAIEDVIIRSGSSPNDPMDDGKTDRCRVFVCTTSKETLQIARLRSYSVSNEDAIAATICEAALATSAATRFFDPVTIGDRQFVDGAFGANNPIEECIVSVGTGDPGQGAIDDNILNFLSKTLVRMATKPESTERRFLARWNNEYREHRYFRFNVDQGLQDVRMTEYDKRSLIESATHDYLHHSAQKDDIRNCISNLVSKDEMTDLDFEITMHEHSSRAFRQRILKNVDSLNNPFLNRSSPCWVVPFERNSRFVDREFLGKIKRKLFITGNHQGIVLYGLGGVGKTQIALELAYQIRDQWPDCSIFWIPAVDRETLEQAYQKISKELRIPVCDNETDDVKALVQKRLGEPSTGRWLLIYDNADDLDMWDGSTTESATNALKQFLPISDQGAIVFTTRSHRVAQHLSTTNIVEVPEMDEHRASRVLRNSLVNKELLNDKETTRELLRRLTFLPLAIVQAASFINENKLDFSRYITLLDGQEQDSIDLLSEDFEDEGRYKSTRNPVATTWLTSFAQIRRQDPLAADYLSFMACINHRDIPLKLLPPASQLNHVKSIGTLSSYSFVRVRHKDGLLDMHRLVHLAMRNWLKSIGSLESWQRSVFRGINDRYPLVILLDQTQWRAVMPHALHILNTTAKDENTVERSSLLHKVALCVFHDGRISEAQELALEASEISKCSLGPEHPATLSCLSSLATIYGEQGLLFKSLKLYEEIFEHLKKSMGSSHPDTLNAMARIAFQAREAGDLQKAEDVGSQVIKHYLKNPGLYHVNTLCAISDMALVYDLQSRTHDAAELGLQALNITKRVLGPDNPHTVAAMCNLGNFYKHQWRLKEAEKFHLETLERNQRVLGPEHPGTIKSMKFLAQTLKLQNRDAEAIATMTECAKLCERVYGPDHPYTMACCYAWLNEWTKPKRQKKDDSLIREIEKAAAIAPADRRESCDEITLIGMHNEKYKEKRIL
ncbi:Acyl transferase/acyl hydrolase/lysophospholipase [Penicillium riverlandense]|uniref:Acyl transferase/acyl hydrolase/lysophospholipase n=1 Tax=Penicillium riverlandense TaxID=1903569 RepID=UPI0025475075|nr:Acyl transferase/acyl hydrolase/lysophospholipase [Penicillium riverlandense]KAJ5818925.1 Acyl transferase/acyl hydrolase/lysophospholipase [Penicillium riverlandense]